MWISVDAVIFPLSVEYTTVVVKVMVVLSFFEQVASDSPRSKEVKLQKHISQIVPDFSITRVVECHSKKYAFSQFMCSKQ